MKQLFLPLILALVLAACSSNPSATTRVATTDSLKENLFEPNSIAKIVAAKHAQLIGVKGDLASFKKYIADIAKEKIGLPHGGISIVPLALDYIVTCIPVDASGDSVYFYFDQLVDSATVTLLSASMNTKNDSIAMKVGDVKKTTDVITFESNLARCGMGVFYDEGEIYVDVLPDYLYDNFKNRVSKELSAYLEIRAKEMKGGFEEDAGLTISFEEVYSRAKEWEDFLNKYPHSFARKEIAHTYSAYMEALLNGMDNTPVFENDSLLPELKMLYEKIMKEPESKSSRLVTAYYNYLARDNFRRTETTGEFLANSNLDSMLAPHLRQ